MLVVVLDLDDEAHVAIPRFHSVAAMVGVIQFRGWKAPKMAMVGWSGKRLIPFVEAGYHNQR